MDEAQAFIDQFNQQSSNSICVTFEWDDEIRKGPVVSFVTKYKYIVNNGNNYDYVRIFSRQIGVPDEDMKSLIKFDFKMFYRELPNQASNKNKITVYLKAQEEVQLEDFMLNVELFNAQKLIFTGYVSTWQGQGGWK